MDPKHLFTDRAADYAKYRPSYPEALVQELSPIGEGGTIVDVGSGTGIFSSQLTSLRATIIGVEPNSAMRAQAERALASHSNFRSVDGSAEALPFEDESVQLVTAAQAFHWFDLFKFKSECRRILQRPGWVALVWNLRKAEDEGFFADYERILRACAPTYKASGHQSGTDEQFQDFFDGKYEKKTFPNPQFLFWEELLGRAKSASYFPREGDDTYESAVISLQAAFDRHKRGGRVDFDYTTELYLGTVKP